MAIQSTEKSTENKRQTAPPPDPSRFKPIVENIENTFSEKIQKSGEVLGRFQRAESPIDVDMSTETDFENWLSELPDSVLGEDSSDGPSPSPDSNLSSMTSRSSSGSVSPIQGFSGFNSSAQSVRSDSSSASVSPEPAQIEPVRAIPGRESAHVRSQRAMTMMVDGGGCLIN